MNSKLKDKFSEIVLKRYGISSGVEVMKREEELLQFLIARGYLQLHDMRVLVVAEETPLIQFSGNIKKSEAIRVIASEYDISERTIANILKGKRHWID